MSRHFERARASLLIELSPSCVANLEGGGGGLFFPGRRPPSASSGGPKKSHREGKKSTNSRDRERERGSNMFILRSSLSPELTQQLLLFSTGHSRWRLCPQISTYVENFIMVATSKTNKAWGREREIRFFPEKNKWVGSSSPRLILFYPPPLLLRADFEEGGWG